MLKDSGSSLLLTLQGESSLAPETLSRHVRTICLDADWPQIAKEREDDPKTAVTAENLAYVIYTSGSTGQPKGAQIVHHSVANFLHSMAREPGLTQHDTLLSVTSISFDIAALEIFLPLATGARLVLAGANTVFDGARLARLLADCRATVMQATPTLWRFLVDSGWVGDRRLKILCGGETLTRELADQLLDRSAELWNLVRPDGDNDLVHCLQSGAGQGTDFHRPADCEHTNLFARQLFTAGSHRISRRALYRWSRFGAWLFEPSGSDGREIHPESVRRRSFATALQHRRLCPLPPGREEFNALAAPTLK